MRCPYCQTINFDEAPVCRECRADLKHVPVQAVPAEGPLETSGAEAPRAPPDWPGEEAAPPVAAAMTPRTCPSCGAQEIASTRVCPDCGWNLDTPPLAEAPALRLSVPGWINPRLGVGALGAWAVLATALLAYQGLQRHVANAPAPITMAEPPPVAVLERPLAPDASTAPAPAPAPTPAPAPAEAAAAAPESPASPPQPALAQNTAPPAHAEDAAPSPAAADTPPSAAAADTAPPPAPTYAARPVRHAALHRRHMVRPAPGPAPESPKRAPHAPRIFDPVWVSRPGLEVVNRLYPPDARDTATQGSAAMDCLIGADGRLRGCALVSEHPQGLGFGPATLRLAPYFRAGRTTPSGWPVAGYRVRIPVEWRLG